MQAHSTITSKSSKVKLTSLIALVLQQFYKIVQFSHFEFSSNMRNSPLQLQKLDFVYNIMKFQWAVFEKNVKNLFLVDIFVQNGQF